MFVLVSVHEGVVRPFEIWNGSFVVLLKSLELVFCIMPCILCTPWSSIPFADDCPIFRRAPVLRLASGRSHCFVEVALYLLSYGGCNLKIPLDEFFWTDYAKCAAFHAEVSSSLYCCLAPIAVPIFFISPILWLGTFSASLVTLESRYSQFRGVIMRPRVLV